jgi:DNA-directed RNA polymerase
MRDKLIASLSARLLTTKDKRSHCYWLWKNIEESDKDFDKVVEEIYNLAIGKVVIGIIRNAPITFVAISIGQAIRAYLSEEQVPEETKFALHCGIKVLESFCNKDQKDSEIKLFDLKLMNKSRNIKDNAIYVLSCTDHDLLDAIIASEDIEQSPEFPLLEPASDWKGGYHPDLKAQLIRGASNGTLKRITPNSAPNVYNALNKLQSTEFLVNQEVFSVYKELMSRQDKAELLKRDYTPKSCSPFKHDKEEMVASRAGMFLEAQFIKTLAGKIGERTFYQAYNCDFRGRIYPLTPYLNEQSSDNAKGLITYKQGVELGQWGAYWLAVHTANSIGEDKLKLDERVEYVEENMDDLIAWATDPLENTGWMEADKAWSTLACAFEWKRLYEWCKLGQNSQESYVCHMPIFIDGSNNGVQHLTALSLDEKIAPLVNLIPTETPGDVYMYVAEKTWEALDVLFENLGDHPVKRELPRLLKEIKQIKMKREVALTKDEKENAFKELDAWRKKNKEFEKLVFIPFWQQFQKDKKLQRKSVKRPVMTLGYGVTRQGVRDQIFDDTKTLTEELKFKDKSWSNPFGDLLRDTMLSQLKGPATMLKLFQDIAEKANMNEKFLEWMVPLTNFPSVQEYIKTKETRVRVRFCKMNKGDGIQLHIQPKESGVLDKRKQLTGAAPNIIHSFDAAHLTLIVNESPFIVTTVHDSFGCHPGNMENLFRITREQFVRFYESDPLAQLLAQTNTLELYPERGTLDLTAVLNSDFAFC